jgi:hypothetical protein
LNVDDSERLARLEEKQVAAREALQLQHTEYQRRLEALNGEAQRIAEIHQEKVGQEVYESQRKEDQRRIFAIEKTQARLYGGIAVLAAVGVTNLINLFS